MVILEATWWRRPEALKNNNNDVSSRETSNLEMNEGGKTARGVHQLHSSFGYKIKTHL